MTRQQVLEINCKCGCGKQLNKYDTRNRVRSFIYGHNGYWRGKKRLDMKDEKHWDWKGDNVGYESLHQWLKRKVGKATKCINGHIAKRYYWANKSGEYKRDLSDWYELCASCNRLDGIHINPRFPKRYA